MQVDYQEIFADDDPDAARAYDIHSAPTLVAGGQKIVGFGPIRKYLLDTAAKKAV